MDRLDLNGSVIMSEGPSSGMVSRMLFVVLKLLDCPCNNQVMPARATAVFLVSMVIFIPICYCSSLVIFIPICYCYILAVTESQRPVRGMAQLHVSVCECKEG